MPQFDFFSFFVQILDLSLFSCLFYLLYLKLVLSKTSEVFKMRSKLKNYITKTNSKNKNNFIYTAAVKWFK